MLLAGGLAWPMASGALAQPALTAPSAGVPAVTTRAPALDLLQLPPHGSYAQWRRMTGWEDRRPFSDSARRFRLEDGALRLESAGDSYLIGRELPAGGQPQLEAWPYLRFTVRIDRVPGGAHLEGEAQDDSAFRIYALLPGQPPRALAYVWSWALPVGAWSARRRSVWGDFRGIHRKAFGQGEPPRGSAGGQWITVEVDLRRDFRARFPGEPLPALAGIALKADSNHTPGGASLAWLRAIVLAQTSLREAGVREGQRLGDTVVWFR